MAGASLHRPSAVAGGFASTRTPRSPPGGAPRPKTAGALFQDVSKDATRPTAAEGGSSGGGVAKSRALDARGDPREMSVMSACVGTRRYV